MKILSKQKSKALSKKIVINNFFEFSHHGYDFKDHISHVFTPSDLIISSIRCLGIESNKNLRTFLIDTFNTSEVLEQRFEYTLQLMGFEFEGEEFIVWFNATGKGTTVESFCKDPGIHHRFCVAILRKMKYTLKQSYIDKVPLNIATHLNKDNSLKKNYLDCHVVSKEQFKKNTPHLR